MIILQGGCDKIQCDTAPPPLLAKGKGAPPVAIVENDQILAEQAHAVKEYFP
jgi:hypothetical protein